MSKSVAAVMAEYQATLDSIFGKGVCVVKQNQPRSNNFVGALANDQFAKFAVAYKQRLERLHTAYESGSKDRNTIIRLAQDVAYARPEGPYGELAAIDFLNRVHLHYSSSPVETEIDLSTSETFVSILNPKAVCNVDGFISDLNLYFEVKSLMDISNNMLDDILRKVREKYNAIVSPDRSSVFDYKTLAHVKVAVQKELENALANGATYLESQIVSGLSFRIGWPPAVVVTSTTVDPFEMAEHRYSGVFDWSYKFLHSKPFLLVITVPPWSNPYHSSFLDMNMVFYRSLCRRVFCQYKNCDFNSEFNIQMFELSKAIGGILFLEIDDNLSSEPKKHIESFLYLNPNATHQLDGRFRHFITYAQKGFLDDFRHDNY
jgi:hypothetical protein